MMDIIKSLASSNNQKGIQKHGEILQQITQPIAREIDRAARQQAIPGGNGTSSIMAAYMLLGASDYCARLHYEQGYDIKRLFDHINHLLSVEMDSLGIEFEITLTPDNLEINADKELVEMVLINLIKNAKEALLEKEEAKIELRGRIDTDRRAIIEVKDNGPGIIREAVDRIFIPFYSTKKEGSGIGLALSRQIMQLHHGSLTVKSEPDIYTIFTLQF